MDPDIERLVKEERLAAAGELAGVRGDAALASELYERACAWRKAAECVLGKVRVCGMAPAPGATGRAADGPVRRCAGDEALPAPGWAVAAGLDGGGVRLDGGGVRPVLA